MQAGRRGPLCFCSLRGNYAHAGVILVDAITFYGRNNSIDKPVSLSPTTLLMVAFDVRALTVHQPRYGNKPVYILKLFNIIAQ